MKALTRRHLIAAMASIPATGAGQEAFGASAAPGCPPSPSPSPDAALLALGREFDQAWDEWTNYFPTYRRFQRLFHETWEAQGVRYDTKRYDECSAQIGFTAVSDHNDKLVDRLDHICARIDGLPVATLAGAGVKVRALQHTLSLHWIETTYEREQVDKLAWQLMAAGAAA